MLNWCWTGVVWAFCAHCERIGVFLHEARAYPRVHGHFKKNKKPLYIQAPSEIGRQMSTDTTIITGYVLSLVPSSVVYSFENEDKQKNNFGDEMINFIFKKHPDMQRDYGKFTGEPRDINNRIRTKREHTVMCLIFQCPYQHIPARSEYNGIQLLCHRYNCQELSFAYPGYFGETATQKLSKAVPSSNHFRKGNTQEWLREGYDPFSFDLVQKISWSPIRNWFLPNVQHVEDRNSQFSKQKSYIFLVKRINDMCGGRNICADGRCC